METKQNPADQEYVRKSIHVGQAVTLVVLPLATYFMPESSVQIATAFDRIVFTLRWEALAASTYFAAIMVVANGRFNTSAINPLSGNDKLLDIKIRFLQNTFEQFVLGSVGRIILSTYLENTVQRVIPVLVVYFILARGIFYYGYTIHPIKRAVGMSMTFNSHFLVYAAILFYFIRDGPLYGLQLSS